MSKEDIQSGYSQDTRTAPLWRVLAHASLQKKLFLIILFGFKISVIRSSDTSGTCSDTHTKLIH